MEGLPFDPLTATASSLSQLLSSGQLTSVELVDILLAQIDLHNKKGRQLRAIISVAPRHHLFDIARRLDNERKEGKIRGPLHGIPIVVKDNICTDATPTFMETTVGSYAFVGAKPRNNATVIERLISKGLIILGKANLTEICGIKTSMMRPGWSAVGGQTQSPFVARRLERGILVWEHTAPGGSSAGSAVSVAAGFAPLALGTDTVGSLITPANRAALYALKPTVGSVPMDGVWALSRSFDAVGGMAKSATDLVGLMDAIMEPQREDSVLDGVTGSSPKLSAKHRWRGLRVGFVDPAVWKVKADFSKWNHDAEKYMITMYETAIAKIRDQGAAVTYPAQAPSPEGFRTGGLDGFEVVAYQEFKEVAAEFFANLEESRVRSLAELIQFNADHPDIEMPAASPDQGDLLAAFGTNTPEPVVEHTLETLRRLGGSEGIDLVLDYYGLDILAAPGDSALYDLAAAAGYPMAIVPLGALRSNGRPFGVTLTTRAHGEDALLHFMTAWETSFPERPTPMPLDAVPFPKSEELLPPDPPIVNVILREWDTRDFRQSSDALTTWLNARWRKSGYSLSMETVYEILKANGREAYRGLGDETCGAFAR